MVLETPGEESVMHQVWSREVEALYCLCNTAYETSDGEAKDVDRTATTTTRDANEKLEGSGGDEGGVGGWQRAKELLRQVQELRLRGAEAEAEKKSRSQAKKTLAKAQGKRKGATNKDDLSLELDDAEQDQDDVKAVTKGSSRKKATATRKRKRPRLPSPVMPRALAADARADEVAQEESPAKTRGRPSRSKGRE